MDRILKRPNQDIISSLAHSCLVGRVVILIYLIKCDDWQGKAKNHWPNK